MLAIDPEKVGFIIIKAREFEVSEDPVEPVTTAKPADEEEDSVFHDVAGDSTQQELRAAIEQLNIEEQYHLVALMWLGRGTYTKDEWSEAVAEARSAHNEHTADYLLGTPLLPDYLEDGLTDLGYSIEDVEMGRL